MIWERLLGTSGAQSQSQLESDPQASSSVPSTPGGVPSLPPITAPDLHSLLFPEEVVTPPKPSWNLRTLRLIGEKAVEFVATAHVLTSQPGCNEDVLRSKSGKIDVDALVVYYSTYDADKLLSYVGAVYLQDGFQTVENWLRPLMALAYREDRTLSGKRAREDDEVEEPEVTERSKIRRDTNWLVKTDGPLPEGFIVISASDTSDIAACAPLAASELPPVVPPPLAGPMIETPPRDEKKWMSVMNEWFHKHRIRAQWKFSSAGLPHELMWTANLSVANRDIRTTGTKSTKHAAKEEAAKEACLAMGIW